MIAQRVRFRVRVENVDDLHPRLRVAQYARFQVERPLSLVKYGRDQSQTSQKIL
jgi:hypothetical protein